MITLNHVFLSYKVHKFFIAAVKNNNAFSC